MKQITRISFALLPFAMGCLVVLAAHRMEHWLFPVVTDFTVKQMQPDEAGVVLSGYMHKRRACQFLGVSVDAAGIEMGLKFLDDDRDNATRPPGSQAWGPWQIFLPVAPPVTSLHVVALHRCHPFWVTQTDLITMPLPEIRK